METNASSGAPLYCTECGKAYSVDDLIRHGNAYVCASCKPAFMQKLAEGADIRSLKMNFAGFWIRVGAAFVDSLILVLVNVVWGLFIATPRNFSTQLALLGVQMFINIGYEIFFIGKYGATPGKMACHLKVVTGDGGTVSYMRATGRYFAK